MTNINFRKISAYQGPEKSPGFLLWHVSTAWRTAIEAVLKEFDLTHPQFVILAALGWLTRRGELITQGAIGKMAGLDPNTTSQIIKGLEKKKLIKRLPSEDGRVKHPHLTPKGQKKLILALPAVEAEDQAFFSHLSSGEQKKMIKIFQLLFN